MLILRHGVRQLASVFALIVGSGPVVSAQQAVPPRFEPLAKNERFRVTGVHGLPELPVGRPSAISADGKNAIFVDNDIQGVRSRLLVFDFDKKNWPREYEISNRTVESLSVSADFKEVLLAGFCPTTKPKKAKEGKEKGAVERAGHITLFDLQSESLSGRISLMIPIS